MLVRVLAMTLCLCLYVVCMSQIGVLSKWINGSNCFLHGSFFRPILHCVVKKFRYLQKWGYFFLEPCPKLRKFCFDISTVEACYRLSSKKVNSPSVIYWTVVGHLSWQYLRAPIVDRCSLSQWSSSSAYSTIPSRGSVSDSWYLFYVSMYTRFKACEYNAYSWMLCRHAFSVTSHRFCSIVVSVHVHIALPLLRYEYDMQSLIMNRPRHAQTYKSLAAAT